MKAATSASVTEKLRPVLEKMPAVDLLIAWISTIARFPRFPSWTDACKAVVAMDAVSYAPGGKIGPCPEVTR